MQVSPDGNLVVAVPVQCASWGMFEARSQHISHRLIVRGDSKNGVWPGQQKGRNFSTSSREGLGDRRNVCRGSLGGPHEAAFPWPTSLDKRTPSASLPGPDFVGFHRKVHLGFLFSEVKSSSESDCPPQVVASGDDCLLQAASKVSHFIGTPPTANSTALGSSKRHGLATHL